MAAPQDLVRLQKMEYLDLGSQDDEGHLALLRPWQDAPALRGVFLQTSTEGAPDKNVYISRDGSGNMIFKDVADGVERTLTDLVGGAIVSDKGWRRHFLLMGG